MSGSGAVLVLQRSHDQTMKVGCMGQGLDLGPLKGTAHQHEIVGRKLRDHVDLVRQASDSVLVRYDAGDLHEAKLGHVNVGTAP